MPKFVWDIDPIMVEIGPIELRYYSLLFVGVFLGGYSLLRWQIVRGGGDEEDASDFIVYGVIGVLAGSRLGHVLFYDLDHALRDPIWVFKIWTGGLASHGATAGLIVAMYYFTRKKGVSFVEGSDRFAFSAALGATLVRVGNFFNSEIVGRVVPDQSWGVKFPRFDKLPDIEKVPYRYPSQLFEVALGLGVLGALYLVDRIAGKEKRPKGLLIATFFALYFTGRFFVEYFKEYQAFAELRGLADAADLTMGQRLSIPGALIGYFGIYLSLKRKLPVGWIDRYADDAYANDDEHDYDDEDYQGDPDVDEEFEGDDEEEKPRTRRAKPKTTKKKVAKTEAKKKRASEDASPKKQKKKTKKKTTKASTPDGE